METPAFVRRDVQKSRHLSRLTARLVHGTPEQRLDVVPPQVVCLKRLIHGRPEVFTGPQPPPGLFGRIHPILLRVPVPLWAAAGRDPHWTRTRLRSVTVAQFIRQVVNRGDPATSGHREPFCDAPQLSNVAGPVERDEALFGLA